jgi:anion-transporting  ArsA/GET3 family ATPase
VAGKGGVGKSTVAGALAQLAHNNGVSVAHVELDGKSPPTGLSSDVTQFSLTPGDALREYLSTHGLSRVGQRLESTGILDLVASTAPGIDDLLVLGKIKQMEHSRTHDLIVVDGPAAGQAIGLLQAATTMQSTVSSGPISQQAQEVRNMVTDPTRCQVLLVTTPAFTPVSELIETREQLLNDVCVSLGPIIVNGMDTYSLMPLPNDAPHDVQEAWKYRSQRQSSQNEAVAMLRNHVSEPVVVLPRYSSTSVAINEMVNDFVMGLESMS